MIPLRGDHQSIGGIMKKTICIECYVDIEVDESRLTKELMDNYERYITDINEDSDFNEFHTQLEKHIANITWHILRGDDDFIEGYGYLSHLLTKQSIQFGSFEDVKD